MELWQRFTARARRAVLSAHSEATGSHAELIGTEHLLVGLLRLREGRAHEVLQHLGVDIDSLRADAEQKMEASSGGGAASEITFTPKAQSVLSLAYSEMRALNALHLGTEHILLGMTRLDGDPVSLLLSNYGVEQDQIRSAMAELSDGRDAGNSTPADSQS